VAGVAAATPAFTWGWQNKTGDGETALMVYKKNIN